MVSNSGHEAATLPEAAAPAAAADGASSDEDALPVPPEQHADMALAEPSSPIWREQGAGACSAKAAAVVAACCGDDEDCFALLCNDVAGIKACADGGGDTDPSGAIMGSCSRSASCATLADAGTDGAGAPAAGAPGQPCFDHVCESANASGAAAAHLDGFSDGDDIHCGICFDHVACIQLLPCRHTICGALHGCAWCRCAHDLQWGMEWAAFSMLV